jgi:hypothetical protein
MPKRARMASVSRLNIAANITAIATAILPSRLSPLSCSQ